MAKVTTLRTGLWRGVRTTDEPLDDGVPELLAEGINGYLPDPETGSGFYARPGITVDRTFTNSTITQALFSLTLSSGTPYNFVFNNGVLSRSTSVGGALTTVTPTGVTISASAVAIYVLPLADSFIVNDGVNLPWIATNLTSTPVTGTYLDYSTPDVLLSRGSTDTRVANAAFNYLLAGVNYAKTATAAGTALPAGTIPANQWGVWRVSVNTTGTITVTAGAANYTTGYASETTAIAAVPSTPAGEWNVGYFTVQTDTGNTFIAGTDALEGGASGNPANVTNYYAGRAAPWQAFGQPVLYYGAVFFILASVNGSTTDARTTIAWSEPNEPTVGYQQDDYDNAWTLTQTRSDPLYALIATNDALYYFRELSIGAVMGAPGVNFQGTATHDVVSGNVGTKFPRSPVLYLNMIYFVDHLSRPWRYPVGGTPQPIWRQCRALFEAATVAAGSPLWSVVEPSLSVVLLRVIQGASGGRTLVFDAPTGIYLGRWEVTGSDLGVQVAGIHQTPTATVPPQVVLSEGDGTSVNSRLWQLNLLDGVTWQDSVSQQELSVTSGWLGYDDHRTFEPTEARVLQYQTNENVTITALGVDASTNTVVVAPKSGGATATGRGVLPLNLTVTRGVKLTASPSVATYATQWRCYQLAVDVSGDGVATVEDR